MARKTKKRRFEKLSPRAKELAAKYIPEEHEAGYPHTQAIAIGISRAVSQAKKEARSGRGRAMMRLTMGDPMPARRRKLYWDVVDGSRVLRLEDCDFAAMPDSDVRDAWHIFHVASRTAVGWTRGLREDVREKLVRTERQAASSVERT